MATETSALMRAMEAEAGTITGVNADAEQLDLLRDPDSGRLPSDIFRRMRSRAEGPGRPKGSGNKRTEQLAKLIVQKFGDPVEAMASIYAMPLDQLCELLMIADGSREREQALAEDLEKFRHHIQVSLTEGVRAGTLSEEKIERLEKLLIKIEDDFRVLKAKPGELALKALTVQRDAAREVAQYVHSKKPVAVDLTMRPDVILNIPGLTDAGALQEFVNGGELTAESLEALEYTPFEPVEDGASADDDDGEGGQ
ncbi:hypothetical protein S2M10_29440 [Sphingomonas sp. S2M10]|uniref:hypothetical protein n=1 Tax=Sphingomonas sp. S2M10 TaxID=2705010 RepID=UPI0014569D52|nr:hypothetical protein [Sphingomonas sp. S2M10]NLS27942.1 hypothetical protein [Sphingomonas sp. S2M10]